MTLVFNNMHIFAFLIILAMSCLFSFFAVDQVRRWALSANNLDIPNERSSHIVPTPKGGGLGIFVVSISVFLVTYVFYPDSLGLAALLYSLTAAMVATIGWFDDRYTLSVLKRLTAYSVAVLIFIVGIGVVNVIHIPAVTNVLYLGAGLGGIFTFIWLIGFINAFNFMDGIDGIAGTQALIAGSVWCILFLFESIWPLAALSGVIAASSLGFLFLNKPPAKIFMGDVGSTFLGFTLAALPVLALQQLQNPRLFVTGALILAPFVFDTTLTLVRRILRREKFLQAHRSHLYQRLVQSGFSHAKVTILYSVLALISSLGALVFYVGPDYWAAIVVIIVLCVHIGLVIAVNTIEQHIHKTGDRRIFKSEAVSVNGF